ncbi:MAG: UDP-N-acetylmuramoyl-L-alanyl-D-glutamate--2,6-diaminopimelate ligase [Moraxella sp.]|nr:UDP-N-acetylmuramoyl-L-alanyl-D-glutamate--2,6-diaminopimelate ligase [Moraxella sp.]
MPTFADFADILQAHISPKDWALIERLPVAGIKTDSRKLQAGDVLALLSINPDTKDSAKHYLAPLQDTVILSEIAPSEMGMTGVSPLVIHVPRLRLILGDFVKAVLQSQQASRLPKVLAVTSTNGKTTISQLAAQLGELSSIPSATMGTAGNGRWGKLTPSTHTTSEVVATHEFAHQMALEGVQLLMLEASSHGLHQHRLQGVPVSVAVFGNLSRDHLDYHGTMAEYAAAKAMLFDTQLFAELHHAVINIDDEFGVQLADKLSQNTQLTVWTYSTANPRADFFAKDIRPSLDGVRFELCSPFGELNLHSPLLGLFNVGNLLASVAGFLALTSPSIRQQMFTSLPVLISQLCGARGRMEQVPSTKQQGCFIVDYAHTPDALEQVLTSLREHCTGKLWTVFGCGGDRDKGKRPLMAQIGLTLADKVVFTSDNPRSEDPHAILADMQAGMTCQQHYQAHIEPDRKQAIAYAINHAAADDIVVVAGKGHETYQEIKGVRYDFDDVAVITALLQSSIQA